MRTAVFLFALLQLSIPNSDAQNLGSFRFAQITTEDGLSQSTINDILQDSRGFLWFATDDGLNRYDGYNFEVYKNIPGDTTSISSNVITGLIEDYSGNLWIATNGGGLNKFDRDHERFIRYRHDPNQPNSLSNDFVTAFHQDYTGVILIGTQAGLNIFDPSANRFITYQAGEGSATELEHDLITDLTKDAVGMIWVATQNGGMYKFDRFSETFTRYGPGDNSGLEDPWVTRLYLDDENTLWVGTQSDGLYRFDRGTETFENFSNVSGDSQTISNNWILSMYEDEYGSFWVGTLNGLNLMDRKTGTFTNISQQQPAYLSNYSISTLYEDNSGVFWIGTRDGALNKLVRSMESFSVFQHDPGNQNSLSDNNVWAILEDRNGEVWIGTQGGGLNRYDPENDVMTRYLHDPDDESSLSDNFVNTLLEDRNGYLWVGTINGLNRLDPESGQVVRMTHDPENPETISGNQITSLLQDRHGIIWIGTLNSGLNGYDPASGEIRRFKHDPSDPESVSHNKVWSLFEDSAGNFWVGTHGYGLNRYDRVNGTFIHYRFNPGVSTSISNDFINFIYEDRQGQLWIGTINGLNRYNRIEETFEHYTTEDGLPNNVIYGIVEDDRGHLWLSTNNGIADFDPESGSVRRYGIGDGLPGNEFRFGAYHSGSEGRIYFGGIDGAVVFEADSLRDNPYLPPVVLTRFQIFNRDVEIGNHSFLKRSITETERIDLDHSESVISFEYSGLHYASPKHNEYAFMLEGFDDGWQYVGSRRFTSYTNLQPGNYRFRVKASNKDGLWNEEGTYVDLRISPPFWQTWWAYSLYFFMFSGVMVGFIQYRVGRERWKKKRIEELNTRLEREVNLRTNQLAEEKAKGDQLLRNILPEDVARELIENGKAQPRRYEEVTVIFTDFKNFTETASSMSAGRLLMELNEVFEAFDLIMEKQGVEKIKTIGDSYMAVAGAPIKHSDHAVRAVRACLEMIRYLEERNMNASVKWDMRVGVHSGSVIAGVVGKNKFTYDIWGDTVIIANRMEIAGEPGRVNVSAMTRDLVRDHFESEYRGKHPAEGKGNLDMYFINGEVR
ncbi:MAG: two-component regulator propeller domain-containing protein [Balneolaceae bacterium]